MSVARLDPRLADYIDQAAEIVNAETGVDLVIVSGYRTEAQQAALRASFRSGSRRGIASEPASRSLHTVGRAVDLQLRYQGHLIPVAETPIEYWDYISELLEPVGVRWGGRFRSPDRNHFEL